jgi:hypothetical protein
LRGNHHHRTDAHRQACPHDEINHLVNGRHASALLYSTLDTLCMLAR